ncbi:hypothetical protein DICPUDRAFT_154641 [Dictyostelium purpureum]|uniref:EGF-like domain-containing protein n=1 Tax=Dictyostelium purpureum TaxID=5786 RepID=F0ZRV7_DICPU|nr:uncharacterized protein DICPUDRAFT_154641 [Dictyostelium purpureum]EGC33337.1 hypothetical protein DICPUDRAFT_154641 [Dictyostelium purpureum]|eukprot:XP_003290153.1 hypothetical protein DICPUDRAFT_154641 [Dictyostelium purpureum]
MSYVENVKNFKFSSLSASTIVEVDSGAEKKNLKELTLSMSNFPDFRGYQFDSVTFTFSSALNPSEVITNFQYLNASSALLSFPSNYLVPFYLHLNSYINFMNHYMGKFQIPTQFYDISNLVNYQSIKMGFVSENFLYQKNIPFKVSPTTNLAFSLTPTNSLTIKPQLPPITDVGYLKTVKYEYSCLSGNLPEYTGQGSAYIYDNNRLTGTIPESWCGTALSVANNQLTGTIPSCFSCYFNSTVSMPLSISQPTDISFTTKMYDRFAGSINKFTNYDKNIPCTTYKPQVRYHNQTTIIISGIDIGHQLNYYYVNTAILGYGLCKSVPQAIIRYGYEYYCNQASILNGKSIILYNMGNNIHYTFALVSNPPTFTSIITTENNKVYAIGTFFSSYLGQSEQTITIAGTDCQVTNTGFTNFTCITSVTLSSEKQLVVIKNDNQTKKVFAVFENNRLNNKQCPNDCVGSPSGDICDLSTGTCVGCPNNCSDHGTCNEIEGKCICEENYIQYDCSELYIECEDPTCSSQGHCDTSDGICDCNNGFGGDKCEFSQHYITSVNPSNENGGEASFYGSFGEQHNQLSIIIGSKTCPVTHSSNDLINCTAPPGKGIHSLNITQNNIVYIGKDIYIYSKVPQNIFGCPKNCSSHGKCNTSNGKCECYLGYTSFDCGSMLGGGNKDNTITTTEPPTSNVDNSTGIVDFQNERINFKIFLKSLNEIDINNNIVNSYSLVSDWTVNKTQSNIYTFEQSPNQDEFKVISTIEQIENDRSVSFAGIDFLLTNNSIKFTVLIKNYKYQSFLNTLQLEMESNTTELTKDDCNSKETQLDTENLKNQYDLSYIKLSKNNVDFVGRFINKVVSDSKPTFLTTSYTKLNDSVTITLHLPHCVNECLIDPDFSALLSSDFSECKSPKQNIKWKIVVGVIVGVVGVVYTDGVYSKDLFNPYCHDNGSLNTFSPQKGSNDVVTPGAEVLDSDLDCFPFITSINIIGFTLSDSFLYHHFPTVESITLSSNTLSDFTQKLPSYKTYRITSNSITNIKMSHLNDITSFYFFNLNYATTFEVDSGADKTNLKSLDIFLTNFPNFEGYQFDSAIFTFGSVFNPSDLLTNFQYLNAIQTVFTFNTNFKVPFYLHLNPYIKVIDHYMGYFETPTQFYDMSNLVNYQSIKMSYVGENFLYQDKIPFKVSPTTNLAFSLTFTTAITIKPQLPPITDVGNLKTAAYRYSYLSGNLPEYNGQGSAYIYDNNKLTGTIPESWCGTALSVANNQLSGSIPSCFSCYLGATAHYSNEISGPNGIVTMATMYDRFAGTSNTFTNYDKSIPCTTYKPQVKYHNQTTIIIGGIDIGHQLNYYYVGSISISTQCKSVPGSVIRYGYEYYCNQNIGIQNLKIFTLYNIGNSLHYTFAFESKPPTFTSIITTENNKVYAVGTFFSSYLGQSEQTITIAGTDCQVTNTGFTNFTCITSVTLSSEKQLVVIKNDNQTKKVFAVFENNRLNNKQCPNDCVGSPSGDICDLSTGTCVGCPNDCSGHGICNESKGKCECNPNYINFDCSKLYIPCPNDCSSHGQCDTNTGICKCDDNYIHDDCSELYIPCPNDCSSHGQCNTNTGICKCDSNYINDDCSELYISCPNDCSSHGQCNTNTGICQCSTNYIQDDCSELYIECPNNCSSHGQCNNNTGICQCSTNYIHDDCSELYISCPIDCGSHGKCNTNTGICKCDDNYIQDDCSELYIQCLNNCSSHGQCNTNTGICKCDDNYIQDDCSELYIECADPICSYQGHCITSNGICDCNNGFGGDKCEFSQHYISSVNPSNENGGEASFYGSFGEQHNQLSVIIGSKTCPVTHSSNDLINCTAPPGKGIHSLNITQNNIVYIGKDIYIYSKIPQNIFECPKNCSSHGKCNTSNGRCDCYLGYTSFDCGSMLGGGNKDNSTTTTEPPTSNVDNSTGIVNFQNERINFKIFLKSLNEIDINNNIVKSYPLVSDWTVIKTQSNIYTFEQSPNKDEFKVISTIEQIENDRSVSFAGIDFLLTNNSIKFTVLIKNYKYQSFLNTLQLEMESNTTELANDDCNNKETQIDTENLKNQYDLSYIKLLKNNIDFVGRFINKVVSDSKPTFLTTSYTKLNDSVTITLHLPHCVNECLIDPGNILS